MGSQRMHWRVLRVATISLWATLLLARGDLELANAVIIILILLMIASLVAQRLKRLPPMWKIRVWSLGQEDPLEKEMATHSSILAWRIPWTEEPGRLQSTGSQSRTRPSNFTSLHFTYDCFMYYQFFNQFCLCPGQQATKYSTSSTRIYKTTSDHRIYHSPLDGHHYNDSEAWD